MGRRIIEQPNGKFAIWSSIVDDFVCLDADHKELLEFFEDDAKRRARDDMEYMLRTTKTQDNAKEWEERIKMIQSREGKKAADLRRKYKFQ